MDSLFLPKRQAITSSKCHRCCYNLWYISCYMMLLTMTTTAAREISSCTSFVNGRIEKSVGKRCQKKMLSPSSLPMLVPLIQPKFNHVDSSSVLFAEYGRGAEIWPPTNEMRIRLEDSFPNGCTPPAAKKASFTTTTATMEAANKLSTKDNEPSTETKVEEEEEEEDPTPLTSAAVKINPRVTGEKRRKVRAAISNILRRAAGAELENDATSSASSSSNTSAGGAGIVNGIPTFIALSLLAFGLIQPVQIFFVLFLSGYVTLLNAWSKSPIPGKGGDGENIILSMPSLPPQGHVPSLISNPLGFMLTNSATYKIWLRTGAIVGLVAPLLAIASYMVPQSLLVKALPFMPEGSLMRIFGIAAGGGNNIVAAKACAGPVFLICCQAISEGISRRVMVPLPLRILIPVAYNTVRLGLIWSWALSTTMSLGYVGRALAVANLVYWATNLFGFLLPTAVVRYMRAHFFCVEAEEVTLREGRESAAGLMS
uniref:DUF7733 domain-containing protein n=2 Tax=Ditylum brightwellii TaxID=49249 RepID=A0A7S4VSJ6_9STRA